MTNDTLIKQKQTRLWKRPGFLIRRVHQIHSAIFEKNTEKFNITPVQYAILTVLESMPNIDQHSLGKQVGIDRTNVADILLRLNRRGLVERTRSTHDKRMMLACLTEKGEDISKAMYDEMEQSQAELLKPLSAKERETLIKLLTMLIEGNNHLGRATLSTPEIK